MNEQPSPTVDLTSCDREPIHLLGAVQAFGFLLAVSSDWMIVHASLSTREHLGIEADAMLGRPLVEIMSPEAVHAIRGRLQTLAGPDAVERIFHLSLQPGGPACDVAVHRSGASVVIEIEPSEIDHSLDSAPTVRAMIARLQRTNTVQALCREAARQVRALTGFERVMIYRFAEDASGEVVAESVRAGLDPYMGLNYPASDIPVQARALYRRNMLRLIADVDATPSPVIPRLSPEGEPLDLSMSTLRSVSPIHLEYLRNMGVAASMSISILENGRLWGLVACHHGVARHLSYERRTAAELFGQMFSLLLESRERQAEGQVEVDARALHDRLMTGLASGGSSFHAIAGFTTQIAQTLGCDGVGLWVDGGAKLEGKTPTREEFLGLVRFLNQASPSRVFATDELGAVHAPARDYVERAAGILAIPISRHPRDYLVLFRGEVAQTVTWAGNPRKPAQPGPNGVRLTPRKSFEAWAEVVRGKSKPWTPVERRIAENLRVTMLEVVLRLSDSAEQERRASQERQELLIAELNHRVRNILGLIRGLVAQSREGAHDIDDYAAVVGGRIQALARAHDQITTDQWGPASLRAMIDAEAHAYLLTKADRVRQTGEDVLLMPQAFSSVALVLHELLTNSAKYGALCDSRGRIDIHWQMDEIGRLVIEWQEIGGPPVKPPTRKGFGTTIIERSIPFDLKGEAHVTYAVTGVRARFVVPASFVRTAPVTPAHPRIAAAVAPTVPLAIHGRALVVEDNMVIALDAEDILLSLGADSVDSVSSVGEALRVIGTAKPGFAILDVNLGQETSFPVAERLIELDVPFVFATGYGEDIAAPDHLAGVPVIKKPYSTESFSLLRPAPAAGSVEEPAGFI